MARVLFLFFILTILVFGSSPNAYAQKQLLVLKKEKVLLRLYPGDEIIFTLKESPKEIRKSYINNLSDTALVAHHDVIPFHQIERIYFKRSNLMNVVGGLLVIGGVGYFLIDQVNVMIKEGEPDFDENVMIASATMVGVGLPMLLATRKYTKIGTKFRLRMADKGSVFYRPDIRRQMDEN